MPNSQAYLKIRNMCEVPGALIAWSHYYLNCFHFPTVINNALGNISVHKSCFTTLIVSLG